MGEGFVRGPVRDVRTPRTGRKKHGRVSVESLEAIQIDTWRAHKRRMASVQ